MSIYDFSNIYELSQKQAQDNSPFNRFAQGFQIGSFMRQQQALSAEKEAKAEELRKQTERAGMLQTSLGEIAAMQDPYERVQGLNNLMVKFPEMADKLKTQASFYSDEVKTNATNQLLPALNALNIGQKDVAIERLTQARDAFKNSGNTRGAQSLDMYIQDIQTATDTAPLVQTGYLTLASILGPDKLTETLSKSQDYAKTQAVMPSEISQEQSKATIKAEEANRAPLETKIKEEQLKQEPYKTQEQIAKTTEQQAKAKYAEQNQQLEVQNKQAELALTNQQKLVAVANAKKINEEVLKITKQVADGKLDISDPEKRFDFEKKLRDEYKSNTTDFVKTRDAYDRMSAIYEKYLKPDASGKVSLPKGATIKSREATQAAGDIGLIFNYMKMLDPGSTVREGEFATAANAAGVPDRILNLYNKLNSGERLTSDQRAAYYNQARDLYKKAKARADEVQGSLSVVVDNYGLNKDNVFSNPKGAIVRTK